MFSQKQAAAAGFCCSYLGVLLVVVLLGADPAAHQVVPDGVGQGEVVVPGRRNVPVLHQGEVKVSVKTPLDLHNVPEPGDAPDTDLLPLLLVGQRRRHVSTKTPGTRRPESGRVDEDEPAEREAHLAGRAGRPRAAPPTLKTLTAGKFQGAGPGWGGGGAICEMSHKELEAGQRSHSDAASELRFIGSTSRV